MTDYIQPLEIIFCQAPLPIEYFYVEDQPAPYEIKIINKVDLHISRTTALSSIPDLLGRMSHLKLHTTLFRSTPLRITLFHMHYKPTLPATLPLRAYSADLQNFSEILNALCQPQTLCIIWHLQAFTKTWPWQAKADEHPGNIFGFYHKSIAKLYNHQLIKWETVAIVQILHNITSNLFEAETMALVQELISIYILTPNIESIDHAFQFVPFRIQTLVCNVLHNAF